MTLPIGKIPIDVLREILSSIEIDKKSVIVGPGIGIDSAILKTEANLIASASDPITGTTADIGWLAVHINANDILASAAKPKWFITTLLFPPKVTKENMLEVVHGINKALKELGASLVAGHTEIAPKVSDTIIFGTMIGEPYVRGRYIVNTNAEAGDSIIVTKGVGIEGTWILAMDYRERLGLDEATLKKYEMLKLKISVKPEVETLVRCCLDGIHAMHDATEGGVLGAIFEIAEASNIGFEVFEEKFPILEETKYIVSRLGLDPLKLISSGTLVIFANSSYTEEIISNLRKNGILATVVGKATKNRTRRIVRKDGSTENIIAPPIDELWRFLSKG